jgi:hypothetical protein
MITISFTWKEIQDIEWLLDHMSYEKGSFGPIHDIIVPKIKDEIHKKKKSHGKATAARQVQAQGHTR